MEPGLNAGPPVLLERVVRRLLPPVVRDQVAGDLWERFRSPSQYAADAAAALPFVLFSQIRRATDLPMLALLSFTLFASLGGFEPAGRTDGMAMAPRVAVATAAGMAMLLLRNAYRPSDRWTARRVVGDVLAVLIAVLVSQVVVVALAAAGLIDPGWDVPAGFLFGGLVFALAMLAMLRAGADLARTGSRPALRGLPVAGIEQDYRCFRRNVRFKTATEAAALSLLVAVALWFGVTADRPVVSALGLAWVAITVVLILPALFRASARALPAGASRAEMLAQYRDALHRQRKATGPASWWYFAPLFAGIAFSVVAQGIVARQPAALIGGLGSIAFLAWMIARVSRDRRRRLQAKIVALDALARLEPG